MTFKGLFQTELFWDSMTQEKRTQLSWAHQGSPGEVISFLARVNMKVDSALQGRVLVQPHCTRQQAKVS